MENRNFPDHIMKLLDKKGYFNLTEEQKLSSHKQTLKKLTKIPHLNYEGGREALKELRGQS